MTTAMEYQKRLTDLLDRNSRLYYEKASPEISDTEFDMLFKKLSLLEKESGHVFGNSPTLRLGNDMLKEFRKIHHPKDNPMYTIDNTYDDKGLLDWLLKYYESPDYGNETPLDIVIEPKYDGISAELHYEKGILKSASTRGDKMIGDDITAGCRTIKSIPLKLFYDDISRHGNDFGEGITDIFVRGEILLPSCSLERINEERKADGLKPFANCRNACSGSIKQLNPKITRKRGLVFRPWDVFFYTKNKGNILERKEIFKRHSEKFQFLKTNSFTMELMPRTIRISSSDDCKAVASVVSAYHSVIRGEKKINPDTGDFEDTSEIKPLPYDCDGVVVKLDSTQWQDNIGTKDNRAIEWAIARKWNEEKEAVTILENVGFQVGRTGNITPVGKLRPVSCDGVTITNVMLNNENFITQMGLRIGIPVKIVRSGSVIPYCTGKATWDDFFLKNGINPEKLKKPAERKIEFPKVCPECGSLLEKNGEIWKCTNYDCPAQRKQRILLFCSRPCMDIADIGPAIVNDLYERMDLHDPFSLYELLSLDDEKIIGRLGSGYGVKIIENLKGELRKSLSKPYLNVLTALGIDGIGRENAKSLISRFPSFDELSEATKDEITAIPGFASKTADVILDWFEKHGEFTSKALKNIPLITYQEKDKSTLDEKNKPLKGLSVVFSGKSEYFSGDKVEEFLSNQGAKCSHAISGRTDYLVTGDKPGGSKIRKASDMKVKIITENEFYKKFGIIVAS